jgi:hypothetical protein
MKLDLELISNISGKATIDKCGPSTVSAYSSSTDETHSTTVQEERKAGSATRTGERSNEVTRLWRPPQDLSTFFWRRSSLHIRNGNKLALQIGTRTWSPSGLVRYEPRETITKRPSHRWREPARCTPFLLEARQASFTCTRASSCISVLSWDAAPTNPEEDVKRFKL